ncbi:hypothetical protein AQUSIP_17630 [Aquicella siphonis]|uniref:Thiamin pyrophosphokinase catalytic domain-containing protein n=1 Tax=Aquicella siphonis TaxID=254247 RepID=A0A5E4PHE7_9COXI|nr:hypothetical protein [Aquicella siphonis]VVC76450.1 hypothetical protein AQUSIP_17630 [Aquicella siphonis]
MKDYLIVADGNFLAREILEEAAQNKTIIALDAAADKLARIGILPDILLGDFDCDTEAHAAYWGIRETFSRLDDNTSPYVGNHGVTIVPRKNQNLTDLIKAIRYSDEHQAASITLICATGGRLDHHEAALRSLRSEYKKERPLILHTEQQTLCYAKNDTCVIPGVSGDKCAILAFPQGMFTSEGLVYDVTDYKLEFGYSESYANALKNSRAIVTITGEALLMLPPQLQAQRNFMQMSEIEQIKMLLRDATAILPNT